MIEISPNKYQTNYAEIIAVILIGYGYANLFNMFVLQHFIPSALHIPAILILIAILFLPVRSALRNIMMLLGMLPMGLRWVFVGLMMIYGIAFYILGPIAPPNVAGWADVSLLKSIEPISQLLTIVIVGAFGLAFLLVTAIGKATPILPRFLLTTLFFCAYLIIGLFIYDDYGMSVDEVNDRAVSISSAKYIVDLFNKELGMQWFGEDVEDIHTQPHRHYPVAFQLPLAFVESMNSWDDDIRDVWTYRHFAIFLFYFCGVVTFYRFATEKFNSWQLGLLGAVFLVFTPHIFGQTFNNVKDPVFMSAFIIALYCAMRYWRDKTIKNALIFGAVAAFASNVRIVIFFLVIFVMLYVIMLELFSPRTHTNKRTKRQTLVTVGVILMTYLPLQVLFFPATWDNPIYYNIEIIIIFSNYVRWEGSIIYMGEWINGQQVPWHYLPVWLSMTIPITYQILFVIGAFVITCLMITKRFRLITDDRREEVALFTLFIVPILGLILIGATMYNDWRQFYFLYIPYLLIVLYAIKLLWGIYKNSQTHVWVKRGLLSFVVMSVAYQAFLGIWMLANHPYQNMFRTTPIVELFGGRSQFDRDMTRAVARQGYEYILSTDDSNLISLCVNDSMANYGLQILPTSDRKRIQRMTCEEDAHYAINIYRNYMEDASLPPSIYTIAVDGLTILSVHPLIP